MLEKPLARMRDAWSVLRGQKVAVEPPKVTQQWQNVTHTGTYAVSATSPVFTEWTFGR